MATALEQAIDAASQDWRLRLSMRLGALLEGGSLSGPWPSGDGGLSHGPFQIYTAVHDVTYQQANDPQFAVQYMLAEYQAGIERVERENPGLFNRDPASAAALAAYYAERPREMYPAERVRGAFAALRDWLAGAAATIAGGVAAGGGILPGRPDPLGGLGALWAPLGEAGTWRRVAAVIIGGGLILGGAGLMLQSAKGEALALVSEVA